MKKKQGAKRTKAAKSAIKDLTPNNGAQVKAGNRNTGSVNPIVVSRDRALGNG